jgi:hypothetical protein
MSTESDLETQGWERRSVLCKPRLSECVELYKELGFEVKQVPLDTENLPEGCSVCYKGDMEKYRVIYTRRAE